jgi:tripartite-type tricarboxylate transporter receptor subunit TctC
MMLRRSLLAAAGLAPFAGPASAQAFPDRPLRLVVPFAPGGSQDVMGRLFANRLGAVLGQSVVVENRGGAGGLLGGQEVARAAPDGHTMLLVTAGQWTIAKALKRQMGYDPDADLAPVIHLVDSPVVLIASAGSGIADVRGLIAAARARPDTLNYASTGIGTNTHLLMEDFLQRAGIRITHVPYRGAAPAFNDLLAGAVQVMFVSAPSVLAGDASKFRVLAVTSPARFPPLPDVPTMIEAGVADFTASIWTGIAVPARTPGPVVARLHAAFSAILGEAEVKERLTTLGATPAGGPPERFAALLREDLARWTGVVARGNISAD